MIVLTMIISSKYVKSWIIALCVNFKVSLPKFIYISNYLNEIFSVVVPLGVTMSNTPPPTFTGTTTGTGKTKASK